MKLSDDEVKALVEWADEGDRRGGTTAWGPRFDAVMFVARRVRGASRGPCPACGLSCERCGQPDYCCEGCPSWPAPRASRG